MKDNLIRLDLFCDSVRDGTHDTPKPKPEGKYLVTSRAIKNNSIDFDNCYFISQKDFDKINKRSLVGKWDVLMTMIGTVGRLFLVKENPDFAIKNIALFKIGDEIKAKWLYYYLSLANVQTYFDMIASGTSQHFIGLGYMRKLRIPNITNKSDKIIFILSAYDNLIESNTKRIRLLEQMAENLYKEWFVRFRFPGYETDRLVTSKLGKLPSSFRVANMGSVFDYYIGGGWGNDDISDDYPVEASVIRGTDFPNVSRYNISSCPRRYHKISNYKSRQLVDGDIVMEISGGTSEQPVGRTILVTQEMIDRFKDGKVICASFCKLIRLNKAAVSPYFFYYWMQYLYDTRIIDRFQLQSTGIINFKFEAFLRKGLVMLPPMEIMQQFDNYIIPIFKEINALATQNEILARQRDLLLPRLMSGKLEVKF